MIALLCLALAGTGLQAAGISAEAKADMVKSRLVRALSKEDYVAALQYIKQLKETGEPLGNELLYFEAKSYYETDSLLLAEEPLTEYLNQAGRKGANYAKALEMYEQIELHRAALLAEQRRQEEAEKAAQRKAEAERRAKLNEPNRRVGAIEYINKDWGFGRIQLEGDRTIAASLYAKSSNGKDIDLEVETTPKEGGYTFKPRDKAANSLEPGDSVYRYPAADE